MLFKMMLLLGALKKYLLLFYMIGFKQELSALQKVHFYCDLLRTKTLGKRRPAPSGKMKWSCFVWRRDLLLNWPILKQMVIVCICAYVLLWKYLVASLIHSSRTLLISHKSERIFKPETVITVSDCYPQERD